MTSLDDDILAFGNMLAKDPFGITARNAPSKGDDIDKFNRYINPPKRTTLLPDQPSMLFGELGVGLSSGAQNVINEFLATGGVFQNIFEGKTDLLERAIERGEATHADIPAKTSFAAVLAAKDLESFTRWAARSLGENVPVVASIIGTGGIGGVIGRLIAKRVVKRQTGILLMKKLAPAAAKRGFGAGALAGASTLGTGETAREHFEATGEIRPLLAIGGGLLKGSLETIMPLAVSRRFGLTSRQTDNLLDKIFDKARSFKTRKARIAAGFTGAAITEAATELTQESIDVVLRDFVDENYEFLGPETRSRLLEAGAAGFLVGGIFGGAAGGLSTYRSDYRKNRMMPDDDGAVGPARVDPTTPPPTEPEQLELGLDPPKQLELGLDPTDEPPPPPTGAPTPPTGAPPPPIDEPPPPTGAGPTEPEPGDFPAAEQGPHTSAETFNTSNYSEIRVFHAGARAVEAAAQEDVKAGRVVQPVGVRRGALSADDIIVDPTDLSGIGELSLDNSRISFAPGVSKSTKASLMRTLNTVSAIVERADTTGRIRETPVTKQKLIRKARRSLAEAHAAGLRVTPVVDESFMTLSQQGELNELLQPSLLPVSDATTAVARVPSTKGKSQMVGRGDDLVFGPPKVTRDTPRDTVDLEQNISLTNKAFLAADKQGRILMDRGEVLRQFIYGGHHRGGHNLNPRDDSFMEKLKNITPAQAEALLKIFPMHLAPKNAKLSQPQLLEKLGKSMRDLAKSPKAKSATMAKRYGLRMHTSEAHGKSFTLLGGITRENEFVQGLMIKRDSLGMGGPRDFHRRAEGLQAIGPNGKKGTYSFDNHKPGEVYVIFANNMDKAAKRNLIKLAKLYQKLMPIFNPTGKMLIGTNTYIGRITGHSTHGINGRYYNIPQAPIISISVDVLRDTTRIMHTGLHEFGHMVFDEHFNDLDLGIKEKIISAYNRSLLRASMGGQGDATRGFFSITRATSLFQSDAYGYGLALLIKPDLQTESMLTTLKSVDADYYLGFSEFLAEQFQRWATTSRKPLDVVEQFFHDVTRLMIRLLRSTFHLKQVKPSHFRPEMEIKAWLDSFMEEQRAVGPFIDERAFQPVPKKGQPSTEGAPAADRDIHSAPSAISVNIEKLTDNLKIPKKKSKGLRESIDRIGRVSKYGFNILQLAQLNPTVESLQKYVELARQWYNAKMKWVSIADERVRQWRALHPKQQDNLAKFIFHIDALKYLKTNEAPRHPTEQELVDIKAKFGLDEEAFGLYFLIREDFDLILDKIEEVGTRDILETFADPNVREAKQAGLAREMQALRARPYFPHGRFGDYVLSIRHKPSSTDRRGKLIHMEQFETKKAAMAAVKDAQQRFPAAVVGVGKMPKEVMPFRGLPPSVLKALKTKLRPSKEQQAWLDDLIAGWAPSASFRQNLSRRQNIPGFSFDAMRTYANYFWHGSNYLARIEFKGRLQESINSMTGEMAELENSGFATDRRQELRDFVQDHLNEIMDPTPDWASIRSLAFIWWLGFSPASAALNFTQVPLVAYPYLASRYTDLKAVGALRKAVFSIHHLYQGKTDKVSDVLLKAVGRAMSQGYIDESQATELASVANPNLTRLLPGNMAQQKIQQFAHIGAWMFHQSEKINRRVVFRAAWELALANPEAKYLTELQSTNALEYESLRQDNFTHQDAVAYLAARDAVIKTQFEYASWARPRFMRGRTGVLFTFFMFLQNMVWFARYSPGNKRYLLMMLFAAGMMGLPGAEDITAMVRLASRRLLGKDVNIEKITREFVVDLMDDDSGIAADLILHGTSRFGFGMPAAADLLGIPFPSFDMSANISMGQVVPGVAQLGPPTGSFEEKFARSTTDAAGASLGIGLNVLKFLADDSLPYGDAKRWERAVPRAMRNIMKARRFYVEGRERTSKSATVLEFDASDPDHLAEIVAQAAGFAPTRLSQKWDRDSMVMETRKFWAVQRGMLMAQFDHAMEIKSRAAAQDIIAAIKRFNNEVPFREMGIRPKELRASRENRERNRRLREIGIPSQRRERRLAKSIDRLFPEIDVEDLRIR